MLSWFSRKSQEETQSAVLSVEQFVQLSKFKPDSAQTVGVEFGSRITDVNGKSIKLQVWDTAGQERFRSVTRSYYRGAAGCVLVYDVTSRDSYLHLTNWLSDARQLATSELVIMLVGNKSDLQDKREVTFMEASRFAQENDLLFLETSAKTGENVDDAFASCARTILSKINSGRIKPEDMGSGIQVGGGANRVVKKAIKPTNAPAGQTQQQGCSC